MCVLEHLGVPLYTVEPAAMSTVPLAVLNRVLLHDLSTDWAALERFPAVCTTWRALYDSVDVHKAALAAWAARDHGALCPLFLKDVLGGDAREACKKLAGLRVAPRALGPDAVALRFSGRRSTAYFRQNMTCAATVGCVLATRVPAIEASFLQDEVERIRRSGKISFDVDSLKAFYEASAAVAFLRRLAACPDARVTVGVRIRFADPELGPGAPGDDILDPRELGPLNLTQKKCLDDIAHDLAGDDPLHRISVAAICRGVGRYGFDRDTLRAIFHDDAFGSGDVAALLEAKLRTWSLYVSEDGSAGAGMMNKRTRFFAGCQCNFDPVGAGSVLIAFEHAVSGDANLLAYPVKSVVVLAERDGRPMGGRCGAMGLSESESDDDY